jgi:sulfur-oxidizing protein SoxY
MLSKFSPLNGLAAACMALVLASHASAQSAAETAEADTVWAGIITDVFGDRPIADGTGVLTLDAPTRAEDAAIVPMVIATTLAGATGPVITKITLVIDQNPSPVAAVFELGPEAGVNRIETRVRVNAYTKVHAVAEASDGKLYGVERYVKASGGCSAPALKNEAQALADVGRIKVKQFGLATADRREAQVMIRHPQYSGLQMDQVTRNYIPAWFITDMTVRQGDDAILKVSGGISLSEDPNIRFSYVPNGADRIAVEAVDTEQKTFKAEVPVESGAS